MRAWNSIARVSWPAPVPRGVRRADRALRPYPLARRAALACAVLLAAIPGGPPRAADTDPDAPRSLACPPSERVGWLGLSGMECDCTFAFDPDTGERTWEFRSEPRVLSLDPEGPAAGRLHRGDRLFAVDGFHITTAEAGRRLATPTPATTLELTIRRNGDLKTVRVPVQGLCRDDPRIRGAAPEAPATPQPPSAPASPPPPPARAPRAGRPPEAAVSEPAPSVPALAPPAPVPAPTPSVPLQRPTPPLPPAAPAPPAPAQPPQPPLRPRAILPRGWMGLSITCDDCSIQTTDTPSGAPVWSFRTPPRIYAVEPDSPADQSGLERGDVLTHIDGVRLTTREGGVRFGSVQPGQAVTWTVRRGGESRDHVVVAQEREGPPTPAGEAPPAPEPPEHLRYAGEVAGAEIEVRGSSSVVVTIEPEGEGVTITTRDATIHIRDKDR